LTVTRVGLTETLGEVAVAAEGCDGAVGAGVGVGVLPVLPPPPPPPPPAAPPPPPPAAPLPPPPADGVTGFEAADAGPVPAVLVAVTVNAYVVPSARPVTVIGLPAPIAVRPPGDAVTV
jgi:hypothetical protein